MPMADAGPDDVMELDLLRQVVAEPDDLAPRLVYADWYDERGDPRGEFIRLQLQLGRRDLSDADRDVLRRREAELLHENVRRWNGLLHRRLYRGGLKNRVGSRRKAIRGWTYRRGFVEEVAVDVRTYARHALLLSELGPIHRLQLFDVAGRSPVEELASCPSLRSIRSLAFRDHRLHLGHLHRLAGSPHIERLVEIDLRGTGLRQTSAEAAFRGRSVRIIADAEPQPYVPPVWQPEENTLVSRRTPLQIVRESSNPVDNAISFFMIVVSAGLGLLFAFLEDDKSERHRVPKFQPVELDLAQFEERERKLVELDQLMEKLRGPDRFSTKAERQAVFEEAMARFRELGMRIETDPTRTVPSNGEARPVDVPPPPPAPPTREPGPSSNR